MSPGTAQFVLTVIALAGLGAWLLAVRGSARIARLGPDETEEIDGSGGGRLIASRVKVVNGAPADVAEGLLRAMGASGVGWAARPVTVKREADGRLTAASVLPPRLVAVPAFSRCEVLLRQAGPGSTEITFRADYTDARRKALAVARILLAAGLLVGAGLVIFIWFKVLPSENRAVRGQAIQAIQMVHLLWPPWLIYSLYRRGRRATELYLDAAAANASVLAEALAAGRLRGQGQG